MSFAWLQQILLSNADIGTPITSQPDLRHSILLQCYFHNVRGLTRCTDVTEFDLVRLEAFETVRGALFSAWTQPSMSALLDGRELGLVIGMMPSNGGYGHAAAFIKSGNCGYLMWPNNGLVSFSSLSSFNAAFMEDLSFVQLCRVPHRTFIFVLTRPQYMPR